MKHADRVYQGKWSTLSLVTTAVGLTAREQGVRFKREVMTEITLRLAGGLMVAGSMLLWLFLPIGAGSDEIMAHSILAMLFTAAGLVVYAYGTRGFRHQLSLDVVTGTMALTKVNINHQGRVVRNIDLDDIESLYLRRPHTRGAMAALFIRLHSNPTPIPALTGEMSELELIHADLCEIIQDVDSHPKANKPEPRRPIPQRMARA